MDITHGEFKDFYQSSSGRNSRNSHSRLSLNGSICSSLEFLPSEEVESHDSEKLLRNPILDKNGTTQFDECENGTVLPVSNFDAVNILNQIGTNSKKLLSSSLSDNSAVSSSSDIESFETLTANSDQSENEQLTQDEIDMQKAIKKMEKLDRILMSKMKHEREVKRQRLQVQKNFYSDLKKLEAENKNGTYSDITSNTSKYLALLPPSQQLDVLLEQHQAVEDFEPIFQTQLYSTHSMPAPEHTSEKFETQSHRPKSSEDKSENQEKTKRDKNTRPAGTKTKRKDESKTNFIERNIELAKDAGSMVAMTEEEKKRLEELLGDTAEEDLPSLEEEDPETPSHLMATRYGEGFTPEQREAEHLQEIDGRLQTLLSHAVFTSISSTSLLHRTIPNTSSEMRDIGRKIARSSVAETMTPEQRLDEIENKLSKLSEKWKEKVTNNDITMSVDHKKKCDVTRPRLSDDQLHRLLDEYSRSTSPNSIVTSNLSKLDYRHDDRSSPVSFASPTSEVLHSSLDLSPHESRPSSRSSDATLTSERLSVVSKPPVLEKAILENLLKEAKQTLGIPDVQDNNEDDPVDPSDSDGSDDLEKT